ncbi:hypothetical protein DINM_003883 [Dirofilaria immitis]|nr:hypothetical protein [Dirofilaria immitis]
MVKILELLESSIFAGYCIYRMLISVHLIAQNIRFTTDNNIYGWIENHHWPEIEIAIATMAIAGLLSGRRFVFCFTVFFFILRTAIAITTVTVDLCAMLMSSVVFLRLFWFIPEGSYRRSNLVEPKYTDEKRQINEINLPFL